MDDYKKLLSDCKDYLQTRYTLLRLELLDKMSRIFGILLFVIVAAFLVMGALAYLSVALVNALSNVMSVWVACIILSALLLIVLVMLYANREKLFINPFVKMLSSMIFDAPRSEDNLPAEKEVNDERAV